MESHLYHLAQVNIARTIAPLDDSSMEEFVAQLNDINALADSSPGFVWRFQVDGQNAIYFRPYDDDRILFNLSVWESIEHLKQFVYKSAHNEVMRRRKEWFEKFDGMYMALWWVKAGHIPTVIEAKQRLEYLRLHGPSPHAFTFKEVFDASQCKKEDFTPQTVRV